MKMKPSLTLTMVSAMLGLFFIMAGTLKLSMWPSEDLHRDIRRCFLRMVRLWPVEVNANAYRKIIGGIELASGMILLIMPGCLKLKLFVNSLLVLSTTTVLANQYWSGEKFERLAQFIVFLLMLICRIVVHFQVQRAWNRSHTKPQEGENVKKLKKQN